MDFGSQTPHVKPKPRTSWKKEGFNEGVLRSVKSLLKSRKELCAVTGGEYVKSGDQERLIEITFLSLSEDTNAAHIQDLGALFLELPDLLKSLHLYSLNDHEVIFLRDTKKPLRQTDDHVQQAHLTRILCLMKASPTFPRLKVDSIFNLLSKYTMTLRYTLDLHSQQKLHPDSSHAEDDDTNQSVSSIEDDFVTAFEHLEEEEPPNTHEVLGRICGTTRIQRDVASQTVPAHCLNSSGSKIIVNSSRHKSSSASFINISGLKDLSHSPLKTSVTTSVSDVWSQGSFCRPSSASSQVPHLLRKDVLSPPAESSDSDCSSPSPIIFLDEEGYQKSLQATLDLPKIPVAKDDIEDSDSEVSEFFDSFDQFDDSDHSLESSHHLKGEPLLEKSPQMRRCLKEKSFSTGMNPHRFKFDRPTLPANVRKPTPRKPASPFGPRSDTPGSPLPVKTSGEDAGSLFSPISSAFSPLGSCATSECCYRQCGHGDTIGHEMSYHTCSDFADSVSLDILGSAIHSHSKMVQKRRRSLPYLGLVVAKEEQEETIKFKAKTFDKETDRKSHRKQKTLLVKGSVQRFAAELVEKSFGSAFKDLQRGVSTCTNALCHLASKLTSSVFQMAFYEIGCRHAFSLKERAISGLASFMVSEAVSSALSELQCVKKQMITNTVARFAADLAEELVFEGIMEVCQFSQPSTPTAAHQWLFECENKVVKSYAKDLSESVIQEAFIELSQADVTFTTQAAISVSLDSIKYGNAESMMQSTQTCTVSPKFQDRNLTTLSFSLEPEKVYTIEQALFFTSGVVSSISVPLAGSALCQSPSSFDGKMKENICPVERKCSDVTHVSDLAEQERKHICSVRNACLSSEVSHTTTDQIDLNQRNVDVSSSSDQVVKPDTLTGFSGNMVNMIVNEAYEVINSTSATKTVDEYADYLTRKIVVKPPTYSTSLPKDKSRTVFADQLAKYIVKQSVDESILMQTSELRMAAPDVNSHIGVKNIELGKQRHVPRSREHQQIPLKCVSSRPSSQASIQHSVLKYCPEEHKGHVADILSALAPYVENKKYVNEGVTGPEITRGTHDTFASCEVQKSTTGPSVRSSMQTNCVSSLMFDSGEALQVEGKPRGQDIYFSTLPDPPPPTPLAPTPVRADRNLRKVTKKLKGELAKEYAPATPPSTPRNPPVNGQESEQKEEFMLKLVTSLSEEVESSEDDEQSESFVEKSEKTSAYASNLANHIVSIATEMASFYLDDKAGPVEIDKRQSLLGLLNERWGYTTCMKNITEGTLTSLWNYAGDMAAAVLSDAKRTAVTRHHKLLHLKKVNCPIVGLGRRRNSSDCRSSERICGVAGQWSRETSGSVLSLPLSSGSPGLTSKYPSCESVTDEYAGHVLQVLKREGASSELIMDQYASRLAYRAIKSGLQQAARGVKLKYSKRIFPTKSSQVTTAQDGHRFLSKDCPQTTDFDRMTSTGMKHHCGDNAWGSSDDIPRNECTDLLHFAESLAHSITCDVRRKLKMSTVCLPKSLTDSCLYKRSTVDEVAGDILISSFSKTLLPFSEKHKLYHSTGSLNEYGYSEGFIQAIEQYARKVVDDTLELSLNSVGLRAAESRKKIDKFQSPEQMASLSTSDCRYCKLKDQCYSTRGACHYVPGQAPPYRIKQLTKPKCNNGGQKSRAAHIDIPKIHIDPEQRAVLAEKIVTAAIEKAERELSNTSLAADSGIGHDAVSFAESLTTEIMTSAMTNIGHTINISSFGKEVIQLGDSAPNQQLSLSVGDDSTGSWSNLSFEDEHPDESSSFLHLSDSDGAEERDEDVKGAAEGHSGRMLLIKNIDIESSTVDPQLRIALQWAVASECAVSELRFQDSIKREFVTLSKRLREKDWKVGDLLHAVLKYCEIMEKTSESERGPHKPLFGWILENV
ncbi:A-kinase anchor protein 11 isoform X2 [Pleurodeles waltl]|uniref:A-kinase anchor protein 11 isoform X2 n=1 Tax=Pleurodeles waltl TaxID=8319 RepID=UPI0037099C87